MGKSAGSAAVLPETAYENRVKLVGYYYFAEKLKSGKGRYGRYASFCILAEQKAARGKLRKVYLPVRLFGTNVDKLDETPRFSLLEVTGTLSSYGGAYVKIADVKVLAPPPLDLEGLSYEIPLTAEGMLAALEAERRGETVKPAASRASHTSDDERKKWEKQKEGLNKRIEERRAARSDALTRGASVGGESAERTPSPAPVQDARLPTVNPSDSAIHYSLAMRASTRCARKTAERSSLPTPREREQSAERTPAPAPVQDARSPTPRERERNTRSHGERVQEKIARGTPSSAPLSARPFRDACPTRRAPTDRGVPMSSETSSRLRTAALEEARKKRVLSKEVSRCRRGK